MDSSFAQSLGPKGGGADSSQTLHTISSFSYYQGASVPFPISFPAAKQLFGARRVDPTCIGGEAGGHQKKSQKGENPFIVGEMA